MKINKKHKKILTVLAALILMLWTAYKDKDQPSQKITSTKKISEGQLIYTRHARCRMGCRYLDKNEVMDVVRSGQVNRRKSNPQAKPCPVVAKEKRTVDGQMARVVYGDCRKGIKIITVIDLDTDHSCHCD